MAQAEEVTVRLDPEAARLYREADEQQRLKWELLMSLQITGRLRSKRGLDQIMHDASEEARRRGLTPDILESILNDES